MKFAVTLTSFLAIAGLPAAQAEDKQTSDLNSELWAFTPAEFLMHLKTAVTSEPGVYTIVTPLKGWVRREHIPALIALLDSTEKCNAVVDVHSSFLPPGSTVGEEAAMMIAGYRDGRYPSRLHASKLNAADRKALREWWAKESASNPQ